MTVEKYTYSDGTEGVITVTFPRKVTETMWRDLAEAATEMAEKFTREERRVEVIKYLHPQWQPVPAKARVGVPKNEFWFTDRFTVWNFFRCTQ